jgi:hypothetical protein
MSNRDKIRSAFLNQPKRKQGELVTSSDGEAQVEVRPLSISARRELARKSVVDDVVDMTRMKLYAIGAMCYEPGTDTLVFEDTDIDVMLGQLCGSDVDKLGDLCVKLMNGTAEAKAEAEKNSEGTPSDNSSS